MGAASKPLPLVGARGWGPERRGGAGVTGARHACQPRAPALSTEARAAAAREVLLAALEDLSQERLKRFRHKLRDAPLHGLRKPWGRLEGADAVDLAEHLIHFDGPERRLDAARKTLKRAGVRDVAALLKEQRLRSERGVGLARVPALRSLPPGQILATGLHPSTSPEKPRGAPGLGALRPQIRGPQGSDPAGGPDP